MAQYKTLNNIYVGKEYKEAGSLVDLDDEAAKRHLADGSVVKATQEDSQAIDEAEQRQREEDELRKRQEAEAAEQRRQQEQAQANQNQQPTPADLSAIANLQ